MNRERGLLYLTVALGVGIVVCGVASVALWLARWQGTAELTARPGGAQTVSAQQWPTAEEKRALAAARACVLRMHSLDSSGFDQDVQKLLDCSTGDLRAEFNDINKQQLKQALGDSTSTRPTIVDSAVVSFGNGRGTFLFAVDATIRKGQAEPQQRHYRVVAEAVLVKGNYLLTGLRYAN